MINSNRDIHVPITEHLPTELHNLIQACQTYNPDDRPSFEQIISSNYLSETSQSNDITWSLISDQNSLKWKDFIFPFIQKTNLSTTPLSYLEKKLY